MTLLADAKEPPVRLNAPPLIFSVVPETKVPPVVVVIDPPEEIVRLAVPVSERLVIVCDPV